MLAGVPAQVLLALLGFGCIAGFGGMLISNLVGVTLLSGVVATWGLLAVCYRQDRVAVQGFFLRRMVSFNTQISSYSRSRKRVRFE